MFVSFANKQQVEPWTASYGLARSLLAMATALTLMSTGSDVLFSPDFQAVPNTIKGAFIAKFNLFELVSPEWVGYTRWIAALVLLIVASGWRPRFTAIPHWWISWSFAGASSVPDGGDHVTTVLTLLLLPIALTDPRRWHWAACPASTLKHPDWHEARRFLAQSSMFVIRLQVAIVYAHAATAKLGVTEWRNGTAMYYWLNHPIFGTPDWMRSITGPLTASSVGVVTLTWSAIAIEAVLFTGLFMVRSWRFYLYLLGVSFHLMIFVFHGLPSFSLAMTAALTAYLLTPEGLAKLARIPGTVRQHFRESLRWKGAHHVNSSEAPGVVSLHSSDGRDPSVPYQLR